MHFTKITDIMINYYTPLSFDRSSYEKNYLMCWFACLCQLNYQIGCQQICEVLQRSCLFTNKGTKNVSRLPTRGLKLQQIKDMLEHINMILFSCLLCAKRSLGLN